MKRNGCAPRLGSQRGPEGSSPNLTFQVRKLKSREVKWLFKRLSGTTSYLRKLFFPLYHRTGKETEQE
jgi:hypothetical protein